MSHATLRITRDDDATGDDYRFDVWDPVQARYERLATLEEASARLQALASAVRELWIAHAPELDTLREPPDEDGDDEFAELRVTAQANRHYDVRSFDSPGWTHFAGYLDQVLAHICGEVGYVVQQSVPPSRTTRRQSGG